MAGYASKMNDHQSFLNHRNYDIFGMLMSNYRSSS
jgi:hypothetical protein